MRGGRRVHRAAHAQRLDGDPPSGVPARRVPPPVPDRQPAASDRVPNRLPVPAVRRHVVRGPRGTRRGAGLRGGDHAASRAALPGHGVPPAADRRLPVPRGRLLRPGAVPATVSARCGSSPAGASTQPDSPSRPRRPCTRSPY
ncbi:hypothetical protein ACU686_27255 [Yinghuangia aomiensis]